MSTPETLAEDHLIYFRFLGRVMGKAVFDRQRIKGHLATHLYSHMLGWPVNFDDLTPRIVHGIIAKLLMLSIVAHVLAALYHQFVRKDGLFSRMWFGDR